MQYGTTGESSMIFVRTQHAKRVLFPLLMTLAVLLMSVVFPFVAAPVQGNSLTPSVVSLVEFSEPDYSPAFRPILSLTNVQPVAFRLLTRQSLVLSVNGECWKWNKDGTSSQAAFDTRDSSTVNFAPAPTVAQPFTETSIVAISPPPASGFTVALPDVRELSGITLLPDPPPPQSHTTA